MRTFILAVLFAAAMPAAALPSQNSPAESEALYQKAIAQYEALLNRPGLDPQQVKDTRAALIDARLDYAQVLWDRDDLGGARAQYRAVLTEDASNAEARADYARLESWRGRYREAKRMALEDLQRNKGDAQSVVTLAQDELWMGRPDEAARDVRPLLEADPKNGDALALASQIRDNTGASVETSYETANQSDNLLIQDAHFATNVTPDNGRTTIGAFFDRTRYSASDVDAEIIVQRPGVHFAHRFSDWAALSADLSYDRISAPEDSSVNRAIGTYAVDLSLWSDDTLRFDLESRKETFDNLLSLAKGISARFDAVTLGFTPDERTQGELRFSRGTYSDGNSENLVELQLDREVLHRPHVTLGVRASQADFARILDGGYFNPLDYRGMELTAAASSSLGPRFDYDVAAGLGTESANPGGGDTAYSASASISYRLGGRSVLELYYDAYNSYQSSVNGFGRHAVGIALEQKF